MTIVSKKQDEDVLEICDEFINDEFLKSEKLNEDEKHYLELSIKYLFTLNGAATVAVTSMFTTIFVEKAYLAKPVLESLHIFLWGCVFSVISIVLKYFGFKNLKEFCEKNIKNLSGLKEYIKFLRNNRNADEKTKLKQAKEKLSSPKYNYSLINIWLTRFSIIFIVFSATAFIYGIYKATLPFKKEIVQIENEQVRFVNDLYHCVIITPLPLTKPN